MEFPSLQVMTLLIQMAAGNNVGAVDGVLTTFHPTRQGDIDPIPFDTEALDALEDRGWIEYPPHADGQPVPTEQGLYAIERYAKVRYKLNVNAKTLRPAGRI